MDGQIKERSANPELIERVTAKRERFLGFLSTRVEDRATAEDILQIAYLRAIERSSEIRDEESTVV